MAMQSSLNIRCLKYVTGHHIRISDLFIFKAVWQSAIGNLWIQYWTLQNFEEGTVISS